MAYAGDPTGTNLTSGQATEINNSSPIDQKYKLGERIRNLRGDADAVGTISSTTLTLNPDNGASGTVVVPGNLEINGSTTTVSTTNTTIEDKLVELATGTSGTPAGDAGLVVERGSSTNAAFVWDESADSWVAATTSATGASTGDLTLTPTDLNVSDIALTPDGISTSHIIAEGSLTIRTDANLIIGDSTVDSIKVGRTNTTACRVHLRSGGADDLVVTGGKVGIGTNSPAVDLEVLDTTASSASQGGNLRLTSNDGAAMASGHRLGALEFAGAEDASSTITVGARIEALCDAGWSASENGTSLLFYTTDGNAAQSEVLKLDSDKLATLAGASQFNGNATFGVDDTGVDVRIFSATGSEGVLYDASEDELALLLTTKLKFHDVGGGEEIFASANGHLEVNAGTTLDMTAPTVDVNASTAVTIDTPGVTITDTTASSATEGGALRLVSNDGAAMASGHRLGVLEFAGAESASAIVVGARIEALCDNGWSGTENGTDLLFYTNDGNDTQAEQMRILANGNIGIGVADPDAGLEVLAGSGSQLKLSFDGTDNATFAVDTAGDLTVTPSGGKMYTGMLGYRSFNNAAIANASGPSVLQSGAVFLQTGNATPGNHVVTLPATTAGVRFTFVFAGAATEGFHISPNANDKIMGHVIKVNGDLLDLGSAGAGTDDKDLILGTASNIGDRVTLVGDGSLGWFVLDAVGDWSLES